MIKKLLKRIIIIIVVLTVLSIVYPDNVIIKFSIVSYERTLLLIWEKLSSFIHNLF